MSSFWLPDTGWICPEAMPPVVSEAYLNHHYKDWLMLHISKQNQKKVYSLLSGMNLTPSTTTHRIYTFYLAKLLFTALASTECVASRNGDGLPHNTFLSTLNKYINS